MLFCLQVIAITFFTSAFIQMENNETGIWALWKGHRYWAVIISTLKLASELSPSSLQEEGQASPTAISNLSCATPKDSFNESSEKKLQQPPRAFMFTDTIPQKQVRATNITTALLTNNCILEQYPIFIKTYLLLHEILNFTKVCSLCSDWLHFQRLNLLNFQLWKYFNYRQRALIKSTSNLPAF